MELVRTPKEPLRGRLTLQPPQSGGPRRPVAADSGRWRRLVTWPRVTLLLLLAVTLGLRLWGIKQGLPYSYNSDEAQHFVPKAIGFLSGDWNPHYFLNPPAYSYLLAIVIELWFGSVDAAVRAYTLHPTEVFVLARVLAAVMGTLAVWLLYGAAQRIFARAGPALLAAAIFGLAFLPIFYSHLALNDTPTLLWVCLALYGIGGVWRDGSRRDYVIAGVGVGLAAATKYTGGWVLALLLVAAARDWLTGAGLSGPAPGRAAPLLWSVAAVLIGVLAFSLGNPYWFLDFHAFIDGVGAQASAASGASEPAKLGAAAGGGIAYYLWVFSWGLGLGPALAAVGGAVALLVRRRWSLFALLVPAPIGVLLFMGVQERYFGRWLMPVFPVVALLAAWAAVELIGWLGRLRRPVPVAAGALVVGAALLVPSLVAVLHDDETLSRPYTTNVARAWMLRHIPAGQNVYIEPIIPGNWTSEPGVSNPFEPDGARWYQYPALLSTVSAAGRRLPGGQTRPVTLDQYEKTLYPGLIARFEAHAFCWVVTGTLQSGRAFVQPGEAPQAVAYYRRLARVGTLRYRISPYAAGTNPVPFGFDWSIDYYPHQYRLPGPVISIYQLHGGACAG